MKNGGADLQKYYQQVYSKNKDGHFLKYREGRTLAEEHRVSLQWIQERVKHLKKDGTLLDFGCGECDFLGHIDASRKIGIDFSETALANAAEKYKNIEFLLGDHSKLEKFNAQCDVVVSFGTIEHVEDPKSIFQRLLNCVKPKGMLIVSCPSFLNVRGVIWMTLATLFKVPMSLSDKHYLSPADIKRLAAELGKNVITKTVDMDVGQGSYFQKDMELRLTNALRDAKMDGSRVRELIQWVMDNREYFAMNEFSGANAVYLIS